MAASARTGRSSPTRPSTRRRASTDRALHRSKAALRPRRSSRGPSRACASAARVARRLGAERCALTTAARAHRGARARRRVRATRAASPRRDEAADRNASRSHLANRPPHSSTNASGESHPLGVPLRRRRLLGIERIGRVSAGFQRTAATRSPSCCLSSRSQRAGACGDAERDEACTRPVRARNYDGDGGSSRARSSFSANHARAFDHSRSTIVVLTPSTAATSGTVSPAK